jgi:hypothetical protein
MAISQRYGRSSRRRSHRIGKAFSSIERLERRDCPAVVGIVGTRDVSEAAGTAQLTVTLSAADRKPVSVDYRVEGTATNAVDYRLLNGASNGAWPVGTITFKPGEVSKTITVGLINDIIRDPGETVKVSLFKPRNVTLGAAQSATITIVDDDNYSAKIVGAARCNEGDSGTYEVRLSSPATKAETFYINTIAGSATAGSDYRPLSRLALVLNKGEKRKQFRVQTVADSLAEADEFLFLSATPATAGFPEVAQKGLTIAGTGATSLPQLSIADATVIEGDSGTTSVAVTVSLSFAVPDSVTFRFQTADGTGKQGVDYQSASGVVTIPAGDTSAVITVNALADMVTEPDETFTITLSAPVNATIEKTVGTVTVVDNDTAFRIDVVFPDKTLSTSQQLTFRLAATRWSQIITGDLPDVPVNGRVIDDLEISATGPYIDGPYGVLGQAGPRATRPTGSQLPYTGVMQFDSADLAMMESSGTLTNVILHEMGHVLGIGTLWGQRNFLDVTDATNPLYVGANALREYRTLAANATATGVPVENTGGAGTAGGHWRESVFKTELMTGYAEQPGVAMPISRMTVGGLQDLGYVVNYAAADPYVLPAITSAAIASRSAQAVTTSRRMSALMWLPTVDLFAAIGQNGAATTSTFSPKQRAFASVSHV